MAKRYSDNGTKTITNDNTNKKYKTSDIILIDDEYCIKCEFYDKTNIFTRWYVNTRCTFCDKDIVECLGFGSDYNAIKASNKIDLTVFFNHLRKSHNENFISIKNIDSDMKKEIVKFSLVKKVIL